MTFLPFIRRIYLISKGCPWNHTTSSTALSNFHIEIFKWALENKCPVSKGYTLNPSTDRRQIEVIEWAKQHGYENKD